MNAAVAILRHEASRWRAFWLVAAAALLMALLSPLVPTLGPYRTADVWSATGFAVALLYGLGAGLLMGVQLLGGELFAGELGFYLSLPITIRRFWGLRLAVAWGTLVVTTAVVAIPALLSWPILESLDALGVAESFGYGWLFLLFLVVLPTIALLLGHSLGIGARARTPWLGVDLLGLVVVGGLWAFTVVALARREAWVEAALLLALFAAFCLVALGLGGWRQLERARTRVSALARLESLWTWGVLGIGALLAVLLSTWWLAVTPADLARVDVWRAGPDLVFATGDYRWRPSYRPLLLVRGSGERFLKLGDWRVLGLDPRGLAVSEDGSFMFFRGADGVVRLDLGAMTLETMGQLPSPDALATDAAGDRLALALDGRIVLAEGAAGRVTGEFRIPSRRPVEALRYDGERLVWVSREFAGRRAVFEFDLGTGRPVVEGEVPGESEDWISVGPHGRLLTLQRPGRTIEVWDLRTLERVARLEGLGAMHSGFLAGGEFVAVVGEHVGDGTSSRLRIIRSSGRPSLDLALPPNGRWIPLGETADEGVVVGRHGSGEGGSRRITSFLTVDPKTGEAVPLAEAEVSLRPAWSPWAAPLAAGVIPLAETESGRYWRLDTADGTLEPVLPRE